MNDIVPKKRCLFGTDGVRDIANRGAMTPEMALRLGRAYVLFLTERGIPRPKILVGRDTRRSGSMLEAALVAGMASAGADSLCVGVTTTPGVSFGVAHFCAQGGAVISASHNPSEYNGIKFLDSSGCKLSDEDELAIEEYLGDNLIDDWRPSGGSVGCVENFDTDFNERYRSMLLSSIGTLEFGGLKVLFDCANGGASPVLPELLCPLDGNFSVVGASPDGLNINEKSGVMAMETLSEGVVKGHFDLGMAFDGDADRVLLTDRKGRVLDGDIILWVLARWLKSKGSLGSGVAATVMSNLALGRQLSKDSIDLFSCPVGDRYVVKTMREKNACLGGEQSGHIIVYPYTKTGDGIYTGFLFLKACMELEEDVQTLADRFGRFPQKLTNFCVPNKNAVMKDQGLLSELEKVSKDLGNSGRVFIRPSGTEPLIRLLVECEDQDSVDRLTKFFGDKIESLSV